MWECGSPDKCGCGPFICISCRGLKVCTVSELRPVLCRTPMSDVNLFRPPSQCCCGRLGPGSLNVLSPRYSMSLSAAIDNKYPPLLLVSRRCVSSIRQQPLVTLELEEPTSSCPLCLGHLLSSLSQKGVFLLLSQERLVSRWRRDPIRHWLWVASSLNLWTICNIRNFECYANET